MRYKGIIFDIDGTAAPLGEVTVSERLRTAVGNASKSGFKLTAATGRSFYYASTVFRNLGLTQPSIMMNGSAIIHPITNEIIWSKAINKYQIPDLLHLLSDYEDSVRFGISPLKVPVRLTATKGLPIYILWVDDLQPEEATRLADAISMVPGIAVHNTPSWTPGLTDMHITHTEATKGHAVEVLIKELGLNPDEVIGVGDSSNDIPLFQAVGRKIAMGNGTDDLKALADEIAPPLSEDGLAQIVERYALEAI